MGSIQRLGEMIVNLPTLFNGAILVVFGNVLVELFDENIIYFAVVQDHLHALIVEPLGFLSWGLELI